MRQTALVIMVASSVLVTGMAMSDDRDRSSRRRPSVQAPAQAQPLSSYQQTPVTNFETQTDSALQTLTPTTMNISISGFDSVPSQADETTHQQSSTVPSTLPDTSNSHQTDAVPAEDDTSTSATATDQSVEAETTVTIEVVQEESIQQQSIEDPLHNTESDPLS